MVCLMRPWCMCDSVLFIGAFSRQIQLIDQISKMLNVILTIAKEQLQCHSHFSHSKYSVHTTQLLSKHQVIFSTQHKQILSVCTVYQINTCMNIVMKFVSDVPDNKYAYVHVVTYIFSIVVHIYCGYAAIKKFQFCLSSVVVSTKITDSPDLKIQISE